MSMNKVLDEKFNEKTITAINEAKSGKNPNKVYDDINELFQDLDSDKWKTTTYNPVQEGLQEIQKNPKKVEALKEG